MECLLLAAAGCLVAAAFGVGSRLGFYWNFTHVHARERMSLDAWCSRYAPPLLPHVAAFAALTSGIEELFGLPFTALRPEDCLAQGRSTDLTRKWWASESYETLENHLDIWSERHGVSLTWSHPFEIAALIRDAAAALSAKSENSGTLEQD